MIVKKVPNPKKSTGKAGRIGGLMSYISAPETNRKSEKCVHYETFNFLTDTLASQTLEMIALAEDAPRSKDPVDHWILSFREGEMPTIEQAREAVGMLVEQFGMTGHLYAWGIHEDTDNVHIHIAINRVNPESFKVVKINKGFDREAAHQAVALIEYKQGWRSENNARYAVAPDGKIAKRMSSQKTNSPPPLKTVQRDMELQSGEKSQIRLAQERAGQIFQEATSWKDLHARLSAAGLRYQRVGSGAMVFVGNAQIGVKASTVDRKAGFGQLQKRFGAYEPSTEIQSNEYFHHTKKPHAVASGAVATNSLRALSECHLAKLGATGKANNSRVLHIDARARGRLSDCLRRGAGLDGNCDLERQPLKDDQPGWDEYQRIREDRWQAKRVALKALRRQQINERHGLARSLRTERRRNFAGEWHIPKELLWPVKTGLRSVLAVRDAARMRAMAERHNQERLAILAKFGRVPQYRQWLGSPQITAPVGTELLEQTMQAREALLSNVLEQLSHGINSSGHVTYLSAGRPLFRDEGRSIVVLDTASTDALGAALATARAKFGNVLTVAGDREFQAKVVATTVGMNLPVRFTDPDLNDLREQLFAARKAWQMQYQPPDDDEIGPHSG